MKKLPKNRGRIMPEMSDHDVTNAALEKDELVEKLQKIRSSICDNCDGGGRCSSCNKPEQAEATYIRKEYVRLKTEGIVCPFCGEDDFDMEGLKAHIYVWCEKYAKVKGI